MLGRRYTSLIALGLATRVYFHAFALFGSSKMHLLKLFILQMNVSAMLSRPFDIEFLLPVSHLFQFLVLFSLGLASIFDTMPQRRHHIALFFGPTPARNDSFFSPTTDILFVQFNDRNVGFRRFIDMLLLHYYQSDNGPPLYNNQK